MMPVGQKSRARFSYIPQFGEFDAMPHPVWVILALRRPQVVAEDCS